MCTRRSCIGHSCAITEWSSTTKEWVDKHEWEAKLVINEGCICQDVDKVFDLLHPRDQAVTAHANCIAEEIASQLDSLVLNNNEKGIKDILLWIAPPSPHEAEMMTMTMMKNKAKEEEKPKVAVVMTEQGMYPCIITFINLVVEKVQADVKPKGSDGSIRINVKLIEVLLDGTLAKVDKPPSYYELFAVIEAKCSMSKENRAFEQLLVYTQQLYTLQHNRRFAWGMVVCGSHIRVCLLGPNEAMFASKVMDIATKPGRKTFVEFLINCSFCDIDQLGLDPTMTYLKDIKCWKIECPMEDGEEVPSYVYSNKVIVAANHLFGWHMQCFLGSLDMPPKGSKLRHDVVVKDSWSYVTDKCCNEVKSLRKIRDALSGRGDIDFEYPRLLHGGCVKLWTGATDDDGNPVFIADNTDYLYCDLPITTTTTGNDAAAADQCPCGHPASTGGSSCSQSVNP
ncbi:hypothetical protein EV182_003480 [Spiromyces aspiralis]|uniref:Uncharacterized protein n=1 Tax=Spiromyces aspiralis TaxID=68401 RepID=A0ACC1HEC4_9FUNG|nr:hypothetical protein EV182_003480 [Spiromyces aspiralis]